MKTMTELQEALLAVDNNASAAMHRASMEALQEALEELAQHRLRHDYKEVEAVLQKAIDAPMPSVSDEVRDRLMAGSADEQETIRAYTTLLGKFVGLTARVSALEHRLASRIPLSDPTAPVPPSQFCRFNILGGDPIPFGSCEFCRTYKTGRGFCSAFEERPPR